MGICYYSMYMGSIKQSIASKKQWSKLSLRERRKRMQPLSKARWSDKSDRARTMHARKMAVARWGVPKTK